MTKEKIRSLLIICRVWHDKRRGTAYHTVTMFVNHCKVKSGIKYGDGKQGLITTIDLLECAGYDIPGGDYDAYKYIYPITEWEEVRVARKKDL